MRFAIFAIVASSPLVFSCGALPGLSGNLPEARSNVEARLDALTALDNRVARVGQALLEANADLCPTVRQSAGWALHSARQYSEEMRPFAIARFRLMGDLPGILAAPPQTAAAQSGLQAGDLITAVNGQPLERGSDEGSAAYDGLSSNIRRLDSALAEGSAILTVMRMGESRSVHLTPRKACGYEVQLNPSDELNARADGRRLYISTALAGFAQSDDELAVILGHELAHHVLRHRSWNDAGGLGRSPNPTAASRERGRGSAEQQADRVGLYLTARGGFDPSVAAPFWRRFGASNWRVRYPQLRHDSAETRARALEGVGAEIEAKRASGQPLLP